MGNSAAKTKQGTYQEDSLDFMARWLFSRLGMYVLSWCLRIWWCGCQIGWSARGQLEPPTPQYLWTSYPRGCATTWTWLQMVNYHTHRAKQNWSSLCGQTAQTAVLRLRPNHGSLHHIRCKECNSGSPSYRGSVRPQHACHQNSKLRTPNSWPAINPRSNTSVAHVLSACASRQTRTDPAKCNQKDQIQPQR